MKIRFYVDIPSSGVRSTAQNIWNFCAVTNPSNFSPQGYTRVAFDVEMPPHLILPPHDRLATADAAKIEEDAPE